MQTKSKKWWRTIKETVALLIVLGLLLSIPIGMWQCTKEMIHERKEKEMNGPEELTIVVRCGSGDQPLKMAEGRFEFYEAVSAKYLDTKSSMGDGGPWTMYEVTMKKKKTP